MSPHEAKVRRARENFVAWIRWYRAAYPKEAPTDEALAKKIGIGKSALSQLLSDPLRMPKLPTIIGLAEATGYSVQQILFTPPPTAPERGK